MSIFEILMFVAIGIIIICIAIISVQITNLTGLMIASHFSMKEKIEEIEDKMGEL